MPASYRIDLRAGVVYSVLEGHVTNEELLAQQQRISADPDFRPTMDHVIDTRNGPSVSITALGSRLIASRTNLGPESRRALIVGAAQQPLLRLPPNVRGPTPPERRGHQVLLDSRGRAPLARAGVALTAPSGSAGSSTAND